MPHYTIVLVALQEIFSAFKVDGPDREGVLLNGSNRKEKTKIRLMQFAEDEALKRISVHVLQNIFGTEKGRKHPI